MNSKLYRCGWCGCPTNDRGHNLHGIVFEKAVRIIKEYGDGHTHKTHGDCCDPRNEESMRVTRDMAIDAQDPSLEGSRI